MTAAEGDVIVLRLWGNTEMGRTVRESESKVSVSFSRRVVKADMRGLVTAGPNVRLRA